MWHNIHMYPYFLFAAIHHLKSSPTFSVRPCSSVGRVTVDLIWRSWVQFHRGQKIFSLPRVVPCFPLLGLTPSGLFVGLSSTLIYTSELLLCSTIRFSDQFDIASETHFSCDAVGRKLWLAILNSLLCPETDRNICIGKQGYVFILLILRTDVLMFHS